ncbi:MAG: hypothetical protein AB7E85_09160 [Pseudobdellovibrionaceae bacterium]
MRCLILALFLLIAALPVQAFAEARSICYSANEAEAEQGIRIHSELMVISLNCQHMFPQRPKTLYQKYREFTARHGTLIAEYERTLINHYAREQVYDPVSEINTVRTNFANKISNDAAKMRPDMFCKVYGPRIDRAAKMSDRDVREWANTFFPGHPVSRPLCNPL